MVWKAAPAMCLIPIPCECGCGSHVILHDKTNAVDDLPLALASLKTNSTRMQQQLPR